MTHDKKNRILQYLGYSGPEFVRTYQLCAPSIREHVALLCDWLEERGVTTLKNDHYERFLLNSPGSLNPLRKFFKVLVRMGALSRCPIVNQRRECLNKKPGFPPDQPRPYSRRTHLDRAQLRNSIRWMNQDDHMSDTAIAQTLGVSTRTIRELREELELPSNPKRSQRIRAIAFAREEGLSTEEIAARVGLTPRQVVYYLQQDSDLGKGVLSDKELIKLAECSDDPSSPSEEIAETTGLSQKYVESRLRRIGWKG